MRKPVSPPPWRASPFAAFLRHPGLALLTLVAAMGSALVPSCGWSHYVDCEDTAGCESSPTEPLQSCDLDLFDRTILGFCTPYVGPGWHTALVKMVPQDQGMPRCPLSARWTGLQGQEVLSGRQAPRLVVGCSVNPLPTCNSLSLACVPHEVGYPPCVLQSGPATCPVPYPHKTTVTPSGGGPPATVCCGPPSDGD